MRISNEERTMLERPLAAFRVLATGSTIFLIGLSSPSAQACGNPIFLETHQAAKLVARAERALDRGDYARVLRTLGEGMYIADRSLFSRRQLLIAVAQLRTGHAELALVRLNELAASDRSSPYLQARRGEALALLGRFAEAAQALDPLAKSDLIPDAEAYRSLAAVREHASDAAGRNDALQRCRQMARRPAICALPLRQADSGAPRS
jgi:predicted Zn-dependent protease